jgi:hypothetical protein
MLGAALRTVRQPWQNGPATFVSTGNDPGPQQLTVVFRNRHQDFLPITHSFQLPACQVLQKT